jgi:hypothetical protein
MSTPRIRVRFASGRVKDFTVFEYAELPSAWLVGARTELLPPGAAPISRPPRFPVLREWARDRVERVLRWLAFL